MNNGLVEERITVFRKNGSTALQGYNDKVQKCGKIFLYFRIGKRYVCANEYRVDFEITKESLEAYFDTLSINKQ